AQILTLQDKIDNFLWDYGGAETAPHLFPDLDEELIGAEGIGFLDSLDYAGPIAEFAEDNLKEGSKLAKFSKGVGSFADVIGQAKDWYERAQQVEDLARIFAPNSTGPWESDGFVMTTNVIFRKVLSDFEIVGINMTISEFVNYSTNAVSATIPDSVVMSKYEA